MLFSRKEIMSGPAGPEATKLEGEHGILEKGNLRGQGNDLFSPYS